MRTVPAAIGAAVLLAALVAAAPASARDLRVPLPDAVAVPTAQPLAATAPVRVTLSMSRDATALTAAARAVSTPGSGAFRRYLTTTEVAARFGATARQRRSVAAWLRHAGLTITSSDPFTMTGLGSAAQVATVLGTDVGSVDVTVAGTTAVRYEPRRRPTLPRAVATAVSAVDVSPRTVTPLPTPLPPHRPHGTGGQAARTAGARITAPAPCSTYYGQQLDTVDPPAYGARVPYSGCWYTPAQVRKAYGFPTALTGKGVTVATVGDEPLTGGRRSIQRWSTAQGVPQLRSTQLTVVGLSQATTAPQGLGEWLGDLEAVHGLAPDANLVYVWSNGSTSGDPYADDLNRIVSDRLADVVSASIGDTIYDDDQLDPILQRAALEGITVNEASGDWGNPVDKGPQNGGYLRDSAWEALVGGTSLALDTTGAYAWETPWAQASTTTDGTAWDPAAPGASEYYYEGGGGVTLVDEPAYQQGVVTNNVVDGVAKRVGPDVSMEADCYVGGYGEAYYTPASATRPSTTWSTGTFCGTSMASPMFAALEADAIQGRQGSRLGFLNPTLYTLYRGAGFHQVTDAPFGAGVTKAVVLAAADGNPAKLITLGQCAAQNAQSRPFALVTPYCGSGYNQVTGLGSPTGALFGLLAGTRG